MSEAISWSIEASIKPGQLDDFNALAEELVQSTQSGPNALAYEWFLSEDEGTCHIYERYSNSAAALNHMAGCGSVFMGRLNGFVR